MFVDKCGDSPTHYPLNEKIYDNNWESKRINSDEGTIRRSGTLESAEPLTATTTETPETDLGSDDDRPDTDSFEKRSDSDPIDNNPIDETNDDLIDENNEETEKAPLRQRVRTPIRIYRTSRIITDPDRQKRRRRKRQF